MAAIACLLMHESIPIYFLSLFLAALFALVAEFILVLIPALRKYHIPRAFIGGILALVIGPQVLGKLLNLNIISQDIQSSWDELALFFVNVVFACIFLGKKVPNFKTSVGLAIPQASLGQTLAWGQYLVGGLVSLFILVPIFNFDESVASFIEISFQGGVGVAVGMGETFKSIGLDDAKSITLALAPMAMLTGILSGIVLINWKSSRTLVQVEEKGPFEEIVKEISINRFQNTFIVQLTIIGLAIWLGQVILNGLHYLEESVLLEHIYESEFVKYIPFFPLALIGGAVLQLILSKSTSVDIVNRQTIKRVQMFSLDAVIIMAIGTINLTVVKDNITVVLILLLAGSLWNISCFLFTYRVLIPSHSFERGIADYGQSMGTTSIGLMFQAIVDKENKSKGREAFAIKQLFFEPFVGGGIITGLSPLLIKKLGLGYFTGISFVLMVSFFFLGYLYSRKQLSAVDDD